MNQGNGGVEPFQLEAMSYRRFFVFVYFGHERANKIRELLAVTIRTLAAPE